MSKKNYIKLGFEAFVESCCYTATKTLFVLPESASIFKRFGRFVVCAFVSDEATRWATRTIDDTYTAVKETYSEIKNEALEEIYSEMKEETDNENK